MNLDEAKKRAISLMLEYSNDGVRIPDGENADYLLSMNRFASDAQMQISNRIGIEASFTIEQLRSTVRGFYRYPLPPDFKVLRSVTRYNEPFGFYSMRNGQLLLNNQHDGIFEIWYEKNPQTLTDTTPNDYEFEVDAHAQYLIPYYMGGMALSEEKEDVSNKLLNIFFDGVANLQNFKAQTVGTIRSVDNW